MKKLKKCEICKGKNFKFLFEQTDKNYNFANKFDLYECSNCKVVFINPQPSSKELKKYYPKERYYAFREIITKEKAKKIKIKLFLYDLYFNPKNKNYLLKILFSPMKFMIRGMKIISRHKLMDFGCGSGQFLYEMKQFKMKVYGIEPGEFDKKTSKDLNIKLDLIKAKYPNNFFEAVTMNHVLQHLENPSKILGLETGVAGGDVK